MLGEFLAKIANFAKNIANMNHSFRNIILSLAVAASLGSAWALDLPVKRVNGKDYYYYAVQRNQTLMDIAKKLNITREDILRNNPGASDGLKVGMNLYLPVAEFQEPDQRVAGQSDGDRYTRYKVESGETLFGIAYKFGVTPDDIVALNPAANTGVKAGQLLLIPGKYAFVNPPLKREISEVPQQSADTVAAVEESAEAPATAPVAEAATPADSTVEEAPVVAAEITEISDAEENQLEHSTIAVVLPLMLNEEQPDKHARTTTDFVRGFMLGLDSMKDSSTPLDVKFFDTKGSAGEIASILTKPELAEVDVVIAPDDVASRKAVLEGLQGKDAYILNLFSASDTSYITNPQVIQTYIPAALMYEKAAETILEEYPDHQPVFISAKGGRDEKKPFTDYLRQQYAAKGVEPIEMSFEGALMMDDLVDLDYTAKYIFIPASGSLNEFNKFIKAVSTLRGDVADPSQIVLFGYPDWITFKDDAKASLHKAEAVIYSRFYNDPNTVVYRDFLNQYKANFGGEPIETAPLQALLGYDSARYLLSNLKDNGGVYSPEEQRPFQGLQSTFMLVTADEERDDDEGRTTGPVNQALYIVKFLPADQVSVQVL